MSTSKSAGPYVLRHPPRRGNLQRDPGGRAVRATGTLALLALLSVGDQARATEGITLLAAPGASPNEVVLTWTGLQPLYVILRAATPVEARNSLNRIGEATARTWTDAAASEDVLFYTVDSLCDPAVDADRDGFSRCRDCQDADGAIRPDAPERCNGLDDDCDGAVDEGWDGDADGFLPCATDPRLRDCDDTDPARNPAAAEACGATGAGNGIDENCNGYTDEGCGDCSPGDSDGDGVPECGGDCDPADGAIHPGAEERCDGKDNDCHTGTVGNCGLADPCNWPGGADVCAGSLTCSCQPDATGACGGFYTCSGFCNTSETGPLHDGCSATGVCAAALLSSANVHACAGTALVPGTRHAGETCAAAAECRSLACRRFCLGGGACASTYCRDFCGGDRYCPAAGTECRLLRESLGLDGICWPSTLPGVGTRRLGEPCLADGECDHGLCVGDGGSRYCTAPCCGDGDCPDGFGCSLAGDRVSTGALHVPSGAPGCSQTADCPSGMECGSLAGLCAWALSETSPMCLLDPPESSDRSPGTACAANGECRSHYCEAGLGTCLETCCSNAECPSGLLCALRFVRIAADRATQARVCVTTPAGGLLQPK